MNKKIYYGWIIVAIGVIFFAVSFGVQYSFGIFFKPLQETLGWSRATTSWAMTIHLVVYGLGMIPVGWAIDHVNARALLSFGALAVGSSLALCSLISEPWQLYLLYGIPLALGLAICGPIIFFTIIPRWFAQKRGLALGIVSGGTGIGTLIGAPASNALITAYGWRSSLVIIGITSAIILLVCAIYIKRVSPGAADAARAGSELGNANRESIPLSISNVPFREAIRTREFFFIAIPNGLTGFTLRLIMVHIAPYATDKGISATAAALAVGTIGGISILGRLVMGSAQDRIGARPSFTACLLVQSAAMMALPFIGTDLAFFVFATLFGFTYGGDIPQVPAMAAQRFGLASLGVVYGLISTFANVGGAIGPVAAGYIFDLTGSYTVIFLTAALGLLVAILLIWKVKFQAQVSQAAGKG